MTEFWTKTLPEWLTAIGTVGAIFSALWLATRDDRIRLRVNVGVRTMIQPGTKYQRDLVAVYVTNLGRRQAIVTTLEWVSGPKWNKKQQRHFVQMVSKDSELYFNAELPTTIGDGGVAAYYMPIENWLDGNAMKLVGETTNPERAAKEIKVKIWTSTGFTATAPLEASLVRRLVKAYNENIAKSAPKVVGVDAAVD